MDLNHLNLRVRNAEACRDFYMEHFGFEPSFEAEGGYFLSNGDGFLLALVPTASHQPMPDGFHIGFGLDEPTEVDAVHERLRTAGVAVGAVETHDDYVSFRCHDPDGTEIEIFWERG